MIFKQLLNIPIALQFLPKINLWIQKGTSVLSCQKKGEKQLAKYHLDGILRIKERCTESYEREKTEIFSNFA